MKIRVFLAGLVSLVVALADAAEAIPEDGFLADIAVRPDGTTVYLFGLTVDGVPRIGYSTRSDPADPATESPVMLVPRSSEASPAQEDHPVALSANGRFIIGRAVDQAPQNLDVVRGLLFDTLAPALPIVVSARQVPLFPPGTPFMVADLFSVSNVGVAVGISGIAVPAAIIGRGIRVTPDGVAFPLEPSPVIGGGGGDPPPVGFIHPTRIAASSGAVVGAQGGGDVGEPIFLDAGGLVRLERPPGGMLDSVLPELLASDAVRERGRIAASAFFETRGSAIVVYESPLSTPSVHVLGPVVLSLDDAALDASSFLLSISRSSPEAAGEFLLRVGGADAAALCSEGTDAGTFLGRPLRRVEGAGVFASSAVGFRFCLAGDREGEVLIGHDLLRELAAIEGSGFDATSQLDLCLIGDNGAQASILCQGTDASFTRALEFSDRARLVRSPKTHPFPLPTCGSGAMQSAFVIPLLAILGRRGRPRG